MRHGRLSVLVLVTWLPISGREAWARGRGSPEVLPAPEAIVRVLRNGPEQEKKRMAELLSFRVPRYARVGAPQVPCSDFDSIDSQSVTLQLPGPQVVLHAVGQFGCQYDFLAILQLEATGWTHLGTIPLLSKYRSPKVRFISLVSSAEKDIVVNDNTVDYGTGIFQRDMTVWALVGSRLEIVFDEIENLTFAVGVRKNGEFGNTQQSQHSLFTFVPAEGQDAPGYRDILEKQVLSDHETTLTRWRLFVWRPEFGRFVGIPTEQ